MINLLPPQQKRELAIETVQRKISIILVFISVFLLCQILILFSIKLYIASKVDSLEKLVLERDKELRSAQFQDFEATITKINQTLSKIQTLWKDQMLITPFLEKLSLLTPEGLYFTNLSFQKSFREIEKEGGQKEKEVFAQVRLGGVAHTRGILFSFKKKLEEEQSFAAVYFSPSSWIAPVNGEFSTTLEFHPY